MSIAAFNTALVDHCLDAADEILVDCCSTNGAAIASSEAYLHGCGTPIITLLSRQAVSVLKILSSPPTSPTTLTARRLNDLIELAHACFYAHIPSEVPVCWRQLYTDASILKFALVFSGKGSASVEDVIDAINSLVWPLDMVLILAGGAGPPSRGRAWIHAALGLLHSILDLKGGTNGTDGIDGTDDALHPTKRQKRKDSPQPRFASGPMFSETAACHFVPPVRHPVARSGPLGLQGFQAYLDRARNDALSSGPLPFVMSGLTDHWPARRADARPWASPDYLRWRTLGGQRLVPVEVGRSYVDKGWRQEIVTFDTVLQALEDDCHNTPAAGRVYLAQHALFTQIPKLREDICIPDACYCATSGDVDDGDGTDSTGCQEPMLNAWLGPGGTITPLHTDPHHNLLAQVVGRKYVRLYSPEQTEGLRPRGREGGVEMANTSAADVGVMEAWDDESEQETTDSIDRDQFLALSYLDCILEPGDTLYIPRGWWHYVRSLSVSFSVSFWWD